MKGLTLPEAADINLFSLVLYLLEIIPPLNKYCVDQLDDKFKVPLRSNCRSSFFYIFVHRHVQYDFLIHLAKFQSIMNIRSHSFFTFISENLRPPLLDLVPRLGCELEKMTSHAQKYLTG